MAEYIKDFNFPHRTRVKKREDYKAIVVHWAGNTGRKDPGVHDSREVVEYMGSHLKGYYHFVLDQAEVHEAVDPATHAAQHAGTVWNRQTIGVCIAQPVYPGASATKLGGKVKYKARLDRFESDLREVGYDVKVEEYSSSQYPYTLSLDPEVAKNAAELCAKLCDQFNIPKVWNPSTKHSIVKKGSETGVVCHHHVSTNGKWDCIPWMEELTIAFTNAGFLLDRTGF